MVAITKLNTAIIAFILNVGVKKYLAQKLLRYLGLAEKVKKQEEGINL